MQEAFQEGTHNLEIPGSLDTVPKRRMSSKIVKLAVMPSTISKNKGLVARVSSYEVPAPGSAQTPEKSKEKDSQKEAKSSKPGSEEKVKKLKKKVTIKSESGRAKSLPKDKIGDKAMDSHSRSHLHQDSKAKLSSEKKKATGGKVKSRKKTLKSTAGKSKSLPKTDVEAMDSHSRSHLRADSVKRKY